MITPLKDAQEISDLLMDLIEKQEKHYDQENHRSIFKLNLASKILNSISGPSDLRLAIDKEKAQIESICGLEWDI